MTIEEANYVIKAASGKGEIFSIYLEHTANNVVVSYFCENFSVCKKIDFLFFKQMDRNSFVQVLNDLTYGIHSNLFKLERLLNI